MKNIVILAGSNGNNLSLAKKFEEEINKQDASPVIIDIIDLNLPVYSANEEGNGVPQSIPTCVETLNRADAMVVLSPEYNGGVTPALINFISWISRSGNENWRECFNEKSVIIGTHSGGGGNHVLIALRNQLAFIGMNVLGRQILTSYQKELNSESLESAVKQMLSHP